MRNLSIGVFAIASAAGLAAAQPVAFTDLGVLNGDTVAIGSFGIDEVAWFRFEVQAPISGLTYLDLTTNGSTNPDGSSADTEIGLFDGAGLVVGDNDDDGIGLASTLSYGAGSGLFLGDAGNLGGNGLAEGENGPLSAGVYWLAIGEFSTNFADGFTIVDAGNEAVDFQLSIFTNVPAPGSAAILAVVGLAATRRRR